MFRGVPKTMSSHVYGHQYSSFFLCKVGLVPASLDGCFWVERNFKNEVGLQFFFQCIFMAGPRPPALFPRAGLSQTIRLHRWLSICFSSKPKDNQRSPFCGSCLCRIMTLPAPLPHLYTLHGKQRKLKMKII